MVGRNLAERCSNTDDPHSGNGRDFSRAKVISEVSGKVWVRFGEESNEDEGDGIFSTGEQWNPWEHGHSTNTR